MIFSFQNSDGLVTQQYTLPPDQIPAVVICAELFSAVRPTLLRVYSTEGRPTLAFYADTVVTSELPYSKVRIMKWSYGECKTIAHLTVGAFSQDTIQRVCISYTMDFEELLRDYQSKGADNAGAFGVEAHPLDETLHHLFSCALSKDFRITKEEVGLKVSEEEVGLFSLQSLQTGALPAAPLTERRLKRQLLAALPESWKAAVSADCESAENVNTDIEKKLAAILLLMDAFVNKKVVVFLHVNGGKTHCKTINTSALTLNAFSFVLAQDDLLERTTNLISYTPTAPVWPVAVSFVRSFNAYYKDVNGNINNHCADDSEQYVALCGSHPTRNIYVGAVRYDAVTSLVIHAVLEGKPNTHERFVLVSEARPDICEKVDRVIAGLSQKPLGLLVSNVADDGSGSLPLNLQGQCAYLVLPDDQ